MSYVKEVATTIYRQLGGKRFEIMTGFYHILAGEENGTPFLRMKLRRNKSGYNYLRIFYDQGRDSYIMEFSKYSADFLRLLKKEKFDDVHVEQMRNIFEEITGVYLTL
jgi:hypothetical protein